MSQLLIAKSEYWHGVSQSIIVESSSSYNINCNSFFLVALLFFYHYSIILTSSFFTKVFFKTVNGYGGFAAKFWFWDLFILINGNLSTCSMFGGKGSRLPLAPSMFHFERSRRKVTFVVSNFMFIVSIDFVAFGFKSKLPDFTLMTIAKAVFRFLTAWRTNPNPSWFPSSKQEQRHYCR